MRRDGRGRGCSRNQELAHPSVRAGQRLRARAEKYKDRFATLRVGTGESPATLPFYEKRGFVRVGRIPRFFADNYEKPIVDGGVLLVDMIVLERKL